MALWRKQARVKAEYRMYEDISDTIKLHDDTVVNIKDLGKQGLDYKTVAVVTKIHERKNILKEISELKLDDKNVKKQKQLEERLQKSDEFFINISDYDRKSIEKVFEKQGENLARTKEWQSYHMIFSGMDQLHLNYQSEMYRDKLDELNQKKNNFLQVREATKEAIEGFEKKHVIKNYKDVVQPMEREQKKLARLNERMGKITTAYSMGTAKLGKYNGDYGKNISLMQQYGTRGGAQYSKQVQQYGMQAQQIGQKMQVLQGKLDKIQKAQEQTKKQIKEQTSVVREKEKIVVGSPLGNKLKEYQNAYRENFGTKHMLPKSVEQERWIQSCQETAKKILQKQKLHAGERKNSKEFNAMMGAMEAIAKYKGERDFSELLKDVKDKSEKYTKEKKKQFRPFPSTMRTTRMKMAAMLGSWADTMQVGMEQSAPQKENEQELAAFYASGGKPGKVPAKLGNIVPDPKTAPHVLKMISAMDENFSGSLRLDDTVGEICDKFKDVCSIDKIAYSMGYGAKGGDQVKDMRLLDVMNTLAKTYGYQPKGNVKQKTVDQELKEMDVDIAELGRM